MKSYQKSRRSEVWVVYQSAIKGQPSGPNAVCDQGEWEAMEAVAPGLNRLIRGGITSEGEAERLARGTSGDPVPRTSKAK
jgi:hypothetical protein